MASFVPQIIKIARERDAAGVSLRMYAVTVIGFCCWITFGLLRGVWPIVLSNGACAVLAAAIMALRLRYGEQNSPK